MTRHRERAEAFDAILRDWSGVDGRVVERASEAEAALAGPRPVDCVVADHDLPASDGVTLLEDVRRRRPDLPFVLVVGDGSEALASRAIAADVTGYVRRRGDGEDRRRLAERLRVALADGRGIGPSTAGAPSPRGETGSGGPDGSPDGDDAASDASAADDGAPGPSTRDEAALEGTVREDGPEQTANDDLERATRDDGADRCHRTLLENLPGIVYRAEVDPSWPFEYVAGDCEAITGYTARALRDDVDWGHEVIHEADRDRVVEAVEAALDREEPFEVRYRIHRRDGEQRWLWERGWTVGDGLIEGFVSDVTEHARRERELERARTLLRDVERLANVGGWAYDPATDEVTVTDGTRWIYEVGPEFEADYERAMAFTHPDDVDRVEGLIEQCVQRGEVCSEEYRVTTASGRERRVRAEATPVQGDDGTTRVRGYVQDVTEQERRTRQVAVLDRLLRGTLREDVTEIVERAERIADATDGEVAASAAEIGAVGSDLLVLADEHREMAALLAEPRRERCYDIEEVVRRPVEEIRDTYPEARLSVSVEDGGAVTASTELETAIGELLDNAVRHSDRDRPTVDVTATRECEGASICVADDGPGIPDPVRRQVERGADLDPPYHDGGTGLWLARWIVLRSGGRLTFASNEPRGTVARIDLLGTRASHPDGDRPAGSSDDVQQ